MKKCLDEKVAVFFFFLAKFRSMIFDDRGREEGKGGKKSVES